MRGAAISAYDDAAPCRHQFPAEHVAAVIAILDQLPTSSPDLLSDAGIASGDWQPLLRAAIERRRGQSAATTSGKYRFIEAVLAHGTAVGAWSSWEKVAAKGRNDFKVTMNDETLVSIESKGCPDGNNTGIWDRPGWADEFFVWCQCSESLTKQPGEGIWSGIATRIAMKTCAEREVVDGFIYWDGRCGTDDRRVPKGFGEEGSLRAEASDISGPADRPTWLPPPCVYLLPKSVPSTRNNPRPPTHQATSLRFVTALLGLMGVPERELEGYVHTSSYEVRSQTDGMQLKVRLHAQSWSDARPHELEGQWKHVRREQ
jgi:hypothetical protein